MCALWFLKGITPYFYCEISRETSQIHSFLLFYKSHVIMRRNAQMMSSILHQSTQEYTRIHKNTQEYTRIHGLAGRNFCDVILWRHYDEYDIIWSFVQPYCVFLCILVYSCVFLGILVYSCVVCFNDYCIILDELRHLEKTRPDRDRMLFLQRNYPLFLLWNFKGYPSKPLLPLFSMSHVIMRRNAQIEIACGFYKENTP